MVSGVAIHDIEHLNLIEVMLGSVCGEDAGNTWVETAAEDSAETCLLELILVSPLPRVLEVSLVLWLIVSGIHIVATASQTGIHDGEVLVRQSEVDDKLRLIAIKESLQLLNVVGIHLSRLNIHLVALGMDILNQLIALFLATASNHKLGENVLVLDDLEGSHGSHATSANHKYSTHL